MTNKHFVEWTIKNASIDFDSIQDDEVKKAVFKAKTLSEKVNKELSIAALPDMFFEFNAENMDSEWSEILDVSQYSFDIDVSNENHTIVITAVDDVLLQISARVLFEVSLKPGVEPARFQEWIEDNGGWAACTITGDWSYLDDEGGDMLVLGIK